MTIDNDIHRSSRSPLGALAHVLERMGLAVTGALCGLFVSVPMARTDIDVLGSVGFVAGMMLCGFAGFYLGIHIPVRMQAPSQTDRDANVIELLSASGTFLAAAAALVSIDLLIFGDTLSGAWSTAAGLCWFMGVGLQAIAGVMARLRRRDNEQVR